MFVVGAIGCGWLRLVAVDRLDKGVCSFHTGYKNRNQPGCGFLRLVAVDRLDKGGCSFHTGYKNRNQAGCGFFSWLR